MKKVKKNFFTSSTADRGIYIKFPKNKVVFSFWGDDDPRNISFSKEDAISMTNFILEHLSKTEESPSEDIYLEEFEKIKERLPKYDL